MEPIRTTKTARLGRVRLYRDDLERIFDIFIRGCSDVTISDSKNRYDSFDDMKKNVGNRALE